MASGPGRTVIVPQTDQKQGLVLFLHGAGDTGPGVHSWVNWSMGEELEFPHLEILYPTAAERPYSPSRGMKLNVWFDFPKGIQQDVPEDLEGLASSVQVIHQKLDEQIQQGTPPNKIILGGLSQGGILALHAGLTYKHPLAGIFVLSSYLPPDSVLYTKLGPDAVIGGSVPVYMAHGQADSLILCDWGAATHKRLVKKSVSASFKSYPILRHDMCEEELKGLRDWILERIPFVSLP